MKITTELLRELYACREGIDYVAQYQDKEAIAVLEHLIQDDKLDWVNWLICRLFNSKQRVQYVVYAAEQVIDIFEKKYPNDLRPRQAIEAAKRCIVCPNKENIDTAHAATHVAHAVDAVDAAGAAYAAYAAHAAAHAAHAVDAVDAADAATHVAHAVDAAVKTEMKIKILDFGITLLKVRKIKKVNKKVK